MAILIPLTWLAMGMTLTVPLSGTVVDSNGHPAAGATVWLGDTITTREGPQVLGTARTDDRGRFRLDRADDLIGRGAMWSPTLWAYRPGSRVAFIEFKGNLPGADEPVRLALGPPASTALRVLQPDGQPARGVRVRLVHVSLKAPRPPDGMLDQFAVTTGDDGRATLDGLAPADVLWLDVTAPGQLVQCLPVDPESGSISLRPLGGLKARIVADDPKALRGWSITARSRPTEPGYRGPYTTHWVRETTGDDGRVAFPAIAVGQVIWEVKAPEGSNYLMMKAPGVAIHAGATESAEIQVVRAVRVEGTVIEEPGGAPVPGVTVDLHSLTHSNGRVNQMVTDAQGRFSSLVLPGNTRFGFSFHKMPRTHFLPPKTPHWADFQVQAGVDRQTFVPPRLRKAAQVRGKVVDESGKPAVRVSVVGLWTSAEYGRNPNSIRVETDSRGEFVMGNLAPKSSVKLSASSGSTAESESVTIPAAGEGEPIMLHLRKHPTLSLSGRVLGDAGRPLAGASVRVKIRPRDQPMNSGSAFAFASSEEVRTGRDGRFKTPDQLPIGYEYRVAAQAPGYEPRESGWIVAPTVLVGDLKLRRLVGTRAVAGHVIDPAGKPVAGAEVFQSGDGPRKTQGKTDIDGRFQVPGVPNAPAFLFVAKDGYHFLGRRVDPRDRSVEFTLRRLDEPPAAPLQPVASPVPRAEERTIVRSLIAEAQKAPGGTHQGPEWMQIPEINAMVDPDRVVEMIENQVIALGPGLLTALAVARFEEGPRKALEMLDAIDQPDMTSIAALGLFDRLGASASPAFRREILDRAVKQARAINHPGQAASLLAKIGDRQLDLGEIDRGSALVREAQALAARPRQPPFPDPRDDLAPALARIELPAALKLLEGQGLQPYQLEAMRAGIVKRIAATDPAPARQILGTIEEHRQPLARRVACLRMAAKDLPAARALAAEDRDPMVEALLPAIAARARAGTDPEGARALLRESIDRLGTFGENLAGRPSPAVATARLLPLAARIDPDRAPDYLWLAVSRRSPLPALPEPMTGMMHDARQQYLNLAELAALAARYDRSAGEVVFAPVADRLVGLHDENSGLGNEGLTIFRAVGTFDARLARALLEALPEDPAAPDSPMTGQPRFRHRSKAQARIALARILAMPPGLRLREPFRTYGDDWFEGFED